MRGAGFLLAESFPTIVRRTWSSKIGVIRKFCERLPDLPRARPDPDRSGRALEGLDYLDRAALSNGRRGAAGVSVDGHVVGPSDAKVVRLQRSSDGRITV